VSSPTLRTTTTSEPKAPIGARILVVEDEPSLAESIEYTLEREGFRPMVAPDGTIAIERFRSDRPALVLLDLMLPSLSGLDVCRIIRAESTVPIVIVTAKGSEADKVAGLELGADDYVTKPFSMRELVSRVRAQLRRAGMGADDGEVELLTGGPVIMDVPRHEVRVSGALVTLPPKEFELLEAFLLAKGRLLTRDFLIEDVWGADYYGDTRTLDVHVKRLRQKIEDDPHHPRHLVTVRGLGYRFVD
jgi:two-component system response regulator RegX3